MGHHERMTENDIRQVKNLLLFREEMGKQERFRTIKKQCDKYEPRRHPGTSGAVLIYDFCRRKKKECSADICPGMKENTNGKDNTGQ